MSLRSGYNFECLDIETLFLVWWDIITILSTKVIGEGQGHYGKIDTKFFCYDLWSMSSQGKGNFEVKFIPELNGNCLDFYPEAGDGPSTEWTLVEYLFTSILKL